MALSNERHRHLLENCLENLRNFATDFKGNENGEEFQIDFAISVQQLREALRCIGHITGSVNTEEILDVIFSDFCIGK